MREIIERHLERMICKNYPAADWFGHGWAGKDRCIIQYPMNPRLITKVSTRLIVALQFESTFVNGNKVTATGRNFCE